MEGVREMGGVGGGGGGGLLQIRTTQPTIFSLATGLGAIILFGIICSVTVVSVLLLLLLLGKEGGRKEKYACTISMIIDLGFCL